MKNFLNKFNNKQFSLINKYIKPRNTQQYYDKEAYGRYEDRIRRANSNQTLANFPKPVKYPDNKAEPTKDPNKYHFIHYFNRQKRDFETRLANHIDLADNSLKAKRGRNLFENNMNKERSESTDLSDVNSDPVTGLLYDFGFDDYIDIRVRSMEKSKTEDELKALVDMLGYADLRDFVALNRYVLEAKNHKDYINQTKARLLSIAMQAVNQHKNEQINTAFKQIERETNDNTSKTNRKVEFLLENVAEAKEFFYKFYYKLREKNSREEINALNDFDKYNLMIQGMSEKQFKENKIDNLNKDSNNFTDYMDKIIDDYRETRSIRYNIDAEDVYNKIKEHKNNITARSKEEIEEEKEDLAHMIKFYAFFKKYEKIYLPTNTETERLIVYFK